MASERELLSDERCSALVAILREVDYLMMWGQVHEARLLIKDKLGDYNDEGKLETG